MECEPRLWVRLARACNNRCLFCLDADNRSGPEPTKEEVLAELDRGRAQGLRRVVLSGGEPTLHRSFVELVAEARRRGFGHVQTVTNGRRFCYPRFLDACLEAGLTEVTFSLHGDTAELHDRLVGTPGAFVQAVAGLVNALGRPGLIVSVDVVINRLNAPRLKEILEFAYGLGAREFDLLQVVPFGRAWENWELLECDPETLAEPLRSALSLRRLPGIRLWTNRLGAPLLEGFEDLIQPPEKLHDEVRGRSHFFRDWLERNVDLPCRGPRCPHCFLEGFCSDLERLRSDGELLPRPMPPCLAEPPATEADGAGPRLAWRGSSTDLHEALEFHIARRYHVKSRRCGSCARDADCQGAPIARIRRDGFLCLTPEKGA